MTDERHNRDHQAVLDAERAVNEQYLREIDQLIAKYPRLVRQIAVTQGQQWLGTAPRPPRIGADAGTGFIGRVSLEQGHPYSDLLAQSFYIASWPVEGDEFQTVSWAADVASVFFEGRASAYPVATSLTGRRTFVVRLTDIVDYADEAEDGIAEPFEPAASELVIPAAPARRRPGVQPTEEQPAAPQCVSTSLDASLTITPTETHATELDESPEEVPSDHSKSETPSAVEIRRRRLRAADAVVKVMEMPKQGRMGVVLPTMQPDQYELVAAASRRGLVVQGQPGTGKTVAAAHRAVYLTSGERGTERVARVAIVGPSDLWVDHIRPIVEELKEPDAEIRLISLPALLQSAVGLDTRLEPGRAERIESSWDLGRVIDQFVRSTKVDAKRRPMEQRVRRVVEEMKKPTASGIGNAESGLWLQGLPGWRRLREEARFLPMLATVALALDSSVIEDPVGHLIVDEAQDVRPLEWRILTSSLLQEGGALSLYGDINQRRSDWSATSWQELAVDLELTDESGHFDFHVLRTGYRSTRQILRFANQLLPAGERSETALRDGPHPTLTQVPADRLTAAAVDTAIDLAKRHLEGTVAIIASEPRPLSVLIRRRKWTPDRHRYSWAQDGATVICLRPDEARGLEFDGVVVVEPRDFPENVGRQGVLYTSLTRANKELAIVHSKRLPRGLRPPR